MNKKIILALAVSSALMLCGCQVLGLDKKPDSASNVSSVSSATDSDIDMGISTFVGTVKSVEQSSFIVEPDKDYWESMSADEIAVSIEDVDFTPEVGDVVKITHTGQMMESYPAQVVVLKIELISKADNDTDVNDSSQKNENNESNENTDTEPDAEHSHGDAEQGVYDDGKIEISAFFDNYEILVDMLEMQLCEPWQMSEDSYTSDGFYLEFDSEYNLCSMKNEGNDKVLLYECALGESAEKFMSALKNNNAVEHYSDNMSAEFFKKSSNGEGVEVISLDFDDNNNVKSWYWNNWPEGDIDFSGLVG